MFDAPASRSADAATLLDLLGSLADGGDRPAVRAFTADGEDCLTYRELDDSARRLAGGLKAHGLTVGEFVAIYAPNSARWVQARLLWAREHTHRNNDPLPPAIDEHLAGITNDVIWEVVTRDREWTGVEP